MALSDLTFKLYTDTGLTALFGGSLELVHESDFSDNPQDFVLYFGSTTANRKLEASSNPGVDQITLTPVYAIPNWDNSEAVALGVSRRPTTPTGYRYEVTTAGTTHASVEPTWPVIIGSTISDGTVVWTCVAEERDVNEITLALSSGDLDTNVAGAGLNIGTQALSGTSNDIAIHIRVENAIPTVSSTIGQPELAISIESVQEGVV
jgi:hypothetical protein